MTHARPGVPVAALLLAFGSVAFAQAPLPLEDFLALASRDEKVSEEAAARLSPVWKDGYAAMVIDLARFFRPARTSEGAERPEDSLGEDDPQTGSAPRAGREPSFAAAARTPESMIRRRLIRFLARQTKKGFGDDLKKWRKWSWTLAYEPHPEYSSFKAAETGWLALTTAGGANRIYKTDETRFVRTTDSEVFDDRGQAWKILEESLHGPNGRSHPREAARRTFWFAWFAQFPDTVLLPAGHQSACRPHDEASAHRGKASIRSCRAGTLHSVRSTRPLRT